MLSKNKNFKIKTLTGTAKVAVVGSKLVLNPGAKFLQGSNTRTVGQSGMTVKDPIIETDAAGVKSYKFTLTGQTDVCAIKSRSTKAALKRNKSAKEVGAFYNLLDATYYTAAKPLVAAV